MPEAPEITIMSEQLDKYLSGCNLLDIKFSGRYSAKSPIGYPHFATKLPLEIVVSKTKENSYIGNSIKVYICLIL